MRDNLPGLGWGDVHLAPEKSLVATACVVEVAVVDNQLLDLRQRRRGTSIQKPGHGLVRSLVFALRRGSKART